MDLAHGQFVDRCIVLGRGYCKTIWGVGTRYAIDLIKYHENIEEFLENTDAKKYPVPETWLHKESHQHLLEPEVVDADSASLKWTEPGEEKLVEFMYGERHFNANHIHNSAKKMTKNRQGTTQGRLDDFFKVTGSISFSKRKVLEQKESQDYQDCLEIQEGEHKNSSWPS